MTGKQSDMGFEQGAPVTEKVRGAKVSRLTSRASRSRVDLRDLKVEQIDIDNAIPMDSHSCMIADAIKRQVKGVKNVSVDIATIRFTDTIKKRRVMFLTPLECQRALFEFDLGRHVEPFRFNLRSTQVTAMHVSVPKIGADGEPVKREVRGKLRRKVRSRDAEGEILRDADGEAIRHEVDVLGDDGEPVFVKRLVAVHEKVFRPSLTKEFVNSTSQMTPSGDHIVGGFLPPTHRASKYRKYGAKGFTWEEGEDPKVVAARYRKAHGVEDDERAR